ncbi:hypothetical protein [Candidatus Magnetomonas plexicatena]|uniref:hypothetical protein n=1 Tax=Candidatus Magnetomonas plexicatena TaxID=2552947 RepID=UPI001C7641C1|nr:hypothetical protein E2O03_007770 [Nitrospirales bacterium LBB_01]
MINPKQKLASAIVFASVFLGSFMGAAVTIITTPKAAAEGLKDKLGDTAEAFKENMTEHLDSVAIRLIENSTHILTKAKMTLGSYDHIIDTIKESLPGILKKS